MDWTAGEVGNLAWSQLWQVTVVAACVAIIVQFLVRRRSHLAHVLWLVVLLKCVTPPVIASPSGLFCWVLPANCSRNETTMTPLLEGNSIAHVLATEAPSLSNANDVPTPLDRLPDSTKVVSPAIIPTKKTANHPRSLKALSNATPLLAIAWLLGAATIAAVAVIRWRCFLRELKTTPQSYDPQLEQFVVQLAAKLGVRRKIQLLITHGRLGPAVIGVFRPVLLLPQAVVEGKTPQDLEPILAHELIHLRRGDLWVGLLQVCVQALWWFHPLVWLVNRLVTRDAERCCDEEVIGELGCDPTRYANSLIDVLELKQHLKPVPVFPGVRPVEVTSMRLERIMQLRHGCRKRTPWWCWVIMSLAAIMVLPGSAFVASARDQRRGKVLADNAGHGQETRLYKVGDLLKSTETAFELSADDARAFLHSQLQVQCSGPWLDHDSHRDTIAQPAKQRLPSMTWSGKKLKVVHSIAGQQKVARALEALRKSNWRPIAIEARIVTGPTSLIQSCVAEWSAKPTRAPTTSRTNQNTPIVRPSDVSATETRELILLDAESSVSPTARVSIEKQLPLECEVLAEEQLRAFTKSVQQHVSVNVMQVPRIVVFDKLTASIQDTCQRQFVVNSRNGVAQTQTVSTGLTVRVCPSWMSKDSVRMRYNITLADLLRVKKKTIKRPSGQELKIEIPEIARAEVAAGVDLSCGQTLLVHGLEQEVDGKEQSIVVLLRVQRAPSHVGPPSGNTKSLTFGPYVRSQTGTIGQVTFEAPASDRRQLFATQQQRPDRNLQSLVSEFNQLITERRYAEAQLLANQAAKEFPDNPVVHAMTRKATAGSRSEKGLATADSQWYLADDVEYSAPRLNSRMQRPKRKEEEYSRIPLHRNVFDADAEHLIPSDIEVIQQVERRLSLRTGNLTHLFKQHRDQFRITKEKIADYVDPPRFVPLIGAAQLHHSHYRCTVHFTATNQATWPVRQQSSAKATEVVYFDVSRYRRVDRLQASLNRQFEFHFDDTPLHEVLAKIGDMTALNITIDQRALASQGIDTDEPIRLQLVEPIKVSSALKLILQPLGLTYQVAEETIKVTSIDAGNEPLAVAYNVADLVIPIPDVVRIDLSKLTFANSPQMTQAGKPDFASLIKLITSTIAPESWEEHGGSGSIAAYEQNLSLVVSQTQEVHAAVADLLANLRKLQDVQVCMAFQLVQVPHDYFQSHGIDFDLTAEGEVLLTEIERALVQKMIANDKAAETYQLPKVTLFNGQAVDMTLDDKVASATRGKPLRMLPIVGKDHKRVHLQTGLQSMGLGKSIAVPAGKSLLVDLNCNANTKPAKGRTFMLITPQVMTAKERVLKRP